MSSTHQAERSSSMEAPSAQLATQAEATDTVQAAQLCKAWLVAEVDFITELTEWACVLTKKSPFAHDANDDIVQRLEHLTTRRNELTQHHARCRTVLATILHCPAAEARLSNLEALLPDADRAELRELRRRTASSLAIIQHLLRTTESRLTRHHTCLGDILGQLLAGAPAVGGYGADGRQSVSRPMSRLQAVS